MAVLAFGSLLIFGFASMQLGVMGPIVSWPVFMIVIVLTSNFWSFISGEWKGISKKTLYLQWFAVLLFLIAIAIMAFDANLLLNLKK